MKSILLGVVVAAGLLLVSSEAMAQGYGRPGFRAGVFIGPGPYFYGPYRPYYYGPAYYPPPPPPPVYYYPPPVYGYGPAISLRFGR